MLFSIHYHELSDTYCMVLTAGVENLHSKKLKQNDSLRADHTVKI